MGRERFELPWSRLFIPIVLPALGIVVFLSVSSGLRMSRSQNDWHDSKWTTSSGSIESWKIPARRHLRDRRSSGGARLGRSGY